MTFRRGQKVTMISDEPWIGQNPLAFDVLPQFGVVYTIRNIVNNDDGAWLRFVELINLPGPFGEAVFIASRFRPVVEPKASTETGFAILDEIRHQQKARALNKALVSLGGRAA